MEVQQQKLVEILTKLDLLSCAKLSKGAICRVQCNCTALVLKLFPDLDWRSPFYNKLVNL